MAKKNWPKKLLAMRMDDDTFLVVETPEDISEDFADQPVAVYELVAHGKFSIEKQVNAKLVKKR